LFRPVPAPEERSKEFRHSKKVLRSEEKRLRGRGHIGEGKEESDGEKKEETPRAGGRPMILGDRWSEGLQGWRKDRRASRK